MRGHAVIENAISGTRRVQPPCWLPGTNLVDAATFRTVGGFDETIRWGEHHHLGRRLAETPGFSTREAADARPCVVKIHDRSADTVLGYAERRRHTGRVEARTAVEPAAVAKAHDAMAVSSARLADWRGARRAANHAAPSARRAARRLLVRTPGARAPAYRHALRLRTLHWRWHRRWTRGSGQLRRMISLPIAAAHGPQWFERCAGGAGQDGRAARVQTR